MAKKKTEPSMDTGPSRLKPSEVKHWREHYLRLQKDLCPLCKRKIDYTEAALDHDHSSGRIRATLHRNCNSVEGRVLHWARRSGSDPVIFLSNLLLYWGGEYNNNPVHPNHRTEAELKVKGFRKRLRRAKRASTKSRLRLLIKETQNEE